MPLRPFDRDVTYLFPPSVAELIPADHPVRYVAEFVDALDAAAWKDAGIVPNSAGTDGAPAYAPRALLSIWLYGFMTGVRSTRKLEAACREQVPYFWLTGWQYPDHNTLWRFYQAHREGMRTLFKRTVRTAVQAGLIDLAVQAVDGTKIAGNAAKERTHDAEALTRILARVDACIADLEAQNTTSGETTPARLPQALRKAELLRQQVQEAWAVVQAEDGPKRTNLTDPDADLMKGRQGTVAGYNGQVMAAPVDEKTAERTGLVITAAVVTQAPHDTDQLLPMLQEAETIVGQRAGQTLADGGYHSGPNLVAATGDGHTIVMPESQGKQLEESYHKAQFTYDEAADTYTCPEGQALTFRGLKQRADVPVRRVYRGTPSVCRACPAFGTCTTNKRQGRTLEAGSEDAALREHRRLMQTETAREAYRQRKQLPEPVFGILKEQMGARRFLLRGLANVQAEWSLLATAFNLRTLAAIWRTLGCRSGLAGPALGAA